MFRLLFRLILLLIIAGLIGAYMLGWRPLGVGTAERPIDRSIPRRSRKSARRSAPKRPRPRRWRRSDCGWQRHREDQGQAGARRHGEGPRHPRGLRRWRGHAHRERRHRIRTEASRRSRPRDQRRPLGRRQVDDDPLTRVGSDCDCLRMARREYLQSCGLALAAAFDAAAAGPPRPSPAFARSFACSLPSPARALPDISQPAAPSVPLARCADRRSAPAGPPSRPHRTP